MLRKLAFSGIIAAAVLGWAMPAWAHVTVAPNEEDSATTKVEIDFPSDPPVVGLLAQPVAGWTAKVTTQKLDTPIQTDDGPVSDVVSQVIWTADNAAAGIQPEQFQG